VRRPGLQPDAQIAVRLAVVAVLVAAAPVQAASPVSEAPPDHEIALESLRLAEGDAFAELISRYDAYLAEHPADVGVHVERCRFLGSATCDDDDERCLHQEEFDACLEALSLRFPETAPAELLRLENLWGEEAIEHGETLLSSVASSWEARERAHVHQKLAVSYVEEEQHRQVIEHARRAMELDPALDLSLIAARAFDSLGEPRDAVTMLVAHPPDPENENVWAERQKVQLLHDLGAHEEAALALGLLSRAPDAAQDHLLEAKVWSKVGRADDARHALELAQQDPMTRWRTREILRQRLELEIASGDAASALAAYDALRADGGYMADPAMRQRIRIALEHPTTWRARDVRDVLGLALGVLLLPLAVALLLVPVHYIGLLRSRTQGNATPPPSRFGLRHCCAVLVVLLLSGLPMLYMEGVSWLEELGSEREISLANFREMQLPDRTLVQGMIASEAITLVGVLLLLRPRDLQQFGRGRWTSRRTLAAVIACQMLLFGFAWLWRGVVSVTEGATAGAATTPLPFVTQVLMAIIRLHGLPVLLLIAAVAVPLTEELIFRGVLLQGFSKHLPARAANGLQALIFASVHEQFAFFPFYLLMGIVLGVLARRSQSLLPPLLLHACNNAIACLAIARQAAGS
jgi:membrane protease YdiL (CAAX protease family)